MRTSRVVIGLLWLGLASCAGRSSSPARSSAAAQLIASMTQDSVSLAVVPLADSVRLGSPVRIAYMFVNKNDSSRVLYADPSAVYYEITDPRGQALKAQHWGEPGVLGDLPRLNVPAGGFVGRIVDLTCVPIGMGPSGRDRNGVCEASFSFRERGRYTVRVRFAPFGRNATGMGSTELVSAPVAITVL